MQFIFLETDDKEGFLSGGVAIYFFSKGTGKRIDLETLDRRLNL